MDESIINNLYDKIDKIFIDHNGLTKICTDKAIEILNR